MNIELYAAHEIEIGIIPEPLQSAIPGSVASTLVISLHLIFYTYTRPSCEFSELNVATSDDIDEPILFGKYIIKNFVCEWKIDCE